MIKPSDSTPSNNSSTESTQTSINEKGNSKELTLLNDPKVNQEDYPRSYLRTIQRRTSFYGYLRGYIPMDQNMVYQQK